MRPSFGLPCCLCSRSGGAFCVCSFFLVALCLCRVVAFAWGACSFLRGGSLSVVGVLFGPCLSGAWLCWRLGVVCLVRFCGVACRGAVGCCSFVVAAGWLSVGLVGLCLVRVAVSVGVVGGVAVGRSACAVGAVFCVAGAVLCVVGCWLSAVSLLCSLCSLAFAGGLFFCASRSGGEVLSPRDRSPTLLPAVG